MSMTARKVLGSKPAPTPTVAGTSIPSYHELTEFSPFNRCP
jgi:hypothetical protein